MLDGILCTDHFGGVLQNEPCIKPRRNENKKDYFTLIRHKCEYKIQMRKIKKTKEVKGVKKIQVIIKRIKYQTCPQVRCSKIRAEISSSNMTKFSSQNSSTISATLLERGRVFFSFGKLSTTLDNTELHS